MNATVNAPVRHYAKVENDFVIDLATSAQTMSKAQGWIDVTDLFPMPQVGWRYYKEFDAFRPFTEQHILLENARKDARDAIDQAAGEARARYITTIAGQQEVYREKFDEAIDYLTNYGNDNINDEDYPLLHLETVIRGVSMETVARGVINSRKRWLKHMAIIEELRIGGKHYLSDCATITEINRLKGHYVHKLNLT